MQTKEKRYTIAFIVFVLCYGILFVVPPYGIGITDEFTFLRTLQFGKPHLYYTADYPHYDFLEMGRFFPAGAMEYNLLLLFTDTPTPFLYYLVHALQFVALVFFLVRILERYAVSRIHVYLAIAAFALTAGFTFTWFRLQMNERDIVLFLAAFLYCQLKYQDSRKPVWLALAVVAANIAIYYKELPSILIGTYAAGFLILSARNNESDRSIRIYHVVLLVSAIAYLALYAVLVLPKGGLHSYGVDNSATIEVLLKSLLNYSFVTDPVIIFVVLPLTVWRIYRVFIRGDAAQPFHDSLLAAACMYVVGHFALKITGDYYFQPAYVAALPPMFYFLGSSIKRIRVWRYALVFSGVLLAVNTMPTGLHYLSYFKYAPANLNAVVDFLARDIKRHSPDRRASIFIDGLGRERGKWVYYVFSEHLRYRGLTERDFDLKSDISENIHEGYFPYMKKAVTPFTVFERGQVPSTSTGDYLIVSLHSLDREKMPDNREYLKSLEENYSLVFKTESRFALPRVNFKELGRYLISMGAKPGERLFGISRHKPSPEIPDYYVFVRK